MRSSLQLLLQDAPVLEVLPPPGAAPAADVCSALARLTWLVDVLDSRLAAEIERWNKADGTVAAVTPRILMQNHAFTHFISITTYTSQSLHLPVHSWGRGGRGGHGHHSCHASPIPGKQMEICAVLIPSLAKIATNLIF